jgi:hypothetical protein
MIGFFKWLSWNNTFSDQLLEVKNRKMKFISMLFEVKNQIWCVASIMNNLKLFELKSLAIANINNNQ